MISGLTWAGDRRGCGAARTQVIFFLLFGFYSLVLGRRRRWIRTFCSCLAKTLLRNRPRPSKSAMSSSGFPAADWSLQPKWSRSSQENKVHFSSHNRCLFYLFDCFFTVFGVVATVYNRMPSIMFKFFFLPSVFKESECKFRLYRNHIQSV